MKTSDVTSAFLQSDNLDRIIFVVPPKEANEGENVWKLIKPMYGLPESERKWYFTISQELQRLGCEMLFTDMSLYCYKKDGKLRGLFSIHVDDGQHCGDQVFEEDIMKPLTQKFKFGAMHEGDFKCLGWNIKHENGDIIVSQEDYIKSKIEKLEIERDAMTTTPEQMKKFRSGVGKTRWLSDQTRPDISYKQLEMSIANQAATHMHVKDMNKMISQIKQNEVYLRYSKLPGKEERIELCMSLEPGYIQGLILSLIK